MKLKLKSKRAALPAVLLIALTGCHNAQEPANPTMASTRTAPTLPVAPSGRPVSAPATTESDFVKSDMETAIAENKNNVFPKGVKINSAEISGGVLLLDFNAAFNQVANLGESGESDVQHELIRIAGGHSTVKKMRVTVDGKHFDSQATDWNTPFSVRPSATGDANSAATNAKAGR